MGKIYRLTESQFTNIIKKLKEQKEVSNYKKDNLIYITREEYKKVLIPSVKYIYNVLINNMNDGILSLTKDNGYINDIIMYLKNNNVLDYDTDDEGFDYYYLNDEFQDKSKEELISWINDAKNNLYDKIIE